MKTFLKLLLTALLAIQVSGCFLKKNSVVKPNLIFAPPLSKIPIPENPPVQGADIPKDKYSRLPPGKQRITVSKGGGYFFNTSSFNWLVWNLKARDFYERLLEDHVKGYNKYVDEWNERLETLKGEKEYPK